MREIIRWFNIDGPLCGIEGTFPRQRDRLVGERGFEPPTPWSRTRCSTRLSHSPNMLPPRTRVRLVTRWAHGCALASVAESTGLEAGGGPPPPCIPAGPDPVRLASGTG